MKINPWMFSHHAVLCCYSCCVGFPFRVLWWSTTVLWFRSLGDTVLCLSLSLTHFLSSSEHKASWEGSSSSTLVACCTPSPNNTCNTDECGERESGWDCAVLMYMPQDPPKQYGATRANTNRKVTETNSVQPPEEMKCVKHSRIYLI